MKNYLVTIHYEIKIEAENEDEAEEIFWQDLEEGNRTAITEFAETITIKEIKKENL